LQKSPKIAGKSDHNIDPGQVKTCQDKTCKSVLVFALVPGELDRSQRRPASVSGSSRRFRSNAGPGRLLRTPGTDLMKLHFAQKNFGPSFFLILGQIYTQKAYFIIYNNHGF
jgi:hypothetical protein